VLPPDAGFARADDALGAVTPLGPDRTVEQLLARELRKAIIDGTLSAGTRLRCRELATRFHVSATPVRLALRELANQGLVDMRPHGGAFVSLPSFEELEEIYIIRTGLEAWLAKLGAGRLTPESLRRLSERWHAAEATAKRVDVELYLHTSWECREICYQAAERPRILKTARLYWERSARYNYLTLARESRLRESLRYTRAFYQACRAGDGERASDAIRSSLERSFEFLTDAFSHEQVRGEEATAE
jgi:DNA-binding GntR family transcriptional regulator